MNRPSIKTMSARVTLRTNSRDHNGVATHGSIKVNRNLAVSPLLVALLFVLAAQIGCASQVTNRRVGNFKEFTVGPGGDIQSAIKAAHYGDTIVLAAGASYKGPIVLVDKGGNSGNDGDYITIRTSSVVALKEGERVGPANATAMAKIVSPNKQSAVATEPQAHHYRFIGIEFSPADDANYVYNLIDLGSAGYSSITQFPHHLAFDRCYVHSTGLNKARRGFALNTAETTITNSYVSGFAGEGDETQAVAGWAGPGPFHIVNNYLEGGAENLLFGGADPSIQNLVPSDIEIKRNYFFKPAAWQGHATIKCTLELKNARRVVIDGNVLDGEIRVTAFVITVRNQDTKAPWSTIEDVQVTNNIVRHHSTGINILGRDNYAPSQEARRIRIANNLFEDVTSTGEIAYFLQINGSDAVTIEHNTVQQGGNIITSYGEPARNFTFRNNLVQYNLYGIACSIGKPCPDLPFCNCLPAAAMKGNVIADNQNVSASYPIDKAFPPGNTIVHSFAELGFVDAAKGNWQLSQRSTFRGKGTDAKDPGIDYAAFNASGVTQVKGKK